MCLNTFLFFLPGLLDHSETTLCWRPARPATRKSKRENNPIISPNRNKCFYIYAVPSCPYPVVGADDPLPDEVEPEHLGAEVVVAKDVVQSLAV